MAEKTSLMSSLKTREPTLEDRREKIFSALMGEYLQDVQNRFELMTSMNTEALDGYASNPAAREKYLKSFEDISPDFQADVLVKLYKGDEKNLAQVQECLKTRDAARLKQLYQEAKKENAPDFAKIREEKGGWRYIGPHGNPELFNEKMSLMKTLINRHETFDGKVDIEGKEQELDGYCAAGVMISLYKMKDYFGGKTFDFLPNAKTAVWPENLVNHLGDSPYIHRSEPGKFGELSEKEGLQPGTLFISTRKNGRPHHMMIFERREGGQNLLMGFNDDKKNTSADKINGIAVDIPGMIRNGLSKLSAEELNRLEQKLTVPPASRDWTSLLKEGKTYTPQEQWEKYYQRKDVKFDTQKHVDAAKQALLLRRQTKGGR